MEDDIKGNRFQVEYDLQENTCSCPICTESVDLDEEMCHNCGAWLDWSVLEK